MKEKTRIIAIIPARGGSKGIPRKNLHDLAGKPLLAYTIDAALKSQTVQRVIVSTDDEEILEVAKEYGAEAPFLRPLELASDETPTLPVVQHAIDFLEKKGYKADVIVVLQPTSPLRREKQIDEAVEKLLETDSDAVVSVCKVRHHPNWMCRLHADKLIWFIGEKGKATRRQDLPQLYALNGAVYVVKRDVLMKEDSLFGEDTRGIVMTEETSVDIDSMFDLTVAKTIIERWTEIK